MISIGAVAYDDDGEELGDFSINLYRMRNQGIEIPDDPKTMAWWATQDQAVFQAALENPQPPANAMVEFVQWCNNFKRPMLVCEPTGFDFSWIFYYLGYYNITHKLQHSAMDINTMAAIALNCDYFDAVKKNFPKRWLPEGVHTHVALEDAREQGYIFWKIKEELQAKLANQFTPE